MGYKFLPQFALPKKQREFDLQLYSIENIENQLEYRDSALKALNESDLILIHRGRESFWDEFEPKLKELGKVVPIVCLGYDPSYWLLSTAPANVVATANTYLTYGGEDNARNMLLYLCKELLNIDVTCDPPHQMPWEGLYHPDAPNYFENIQEYLK